MEFLYERDMPDEIKKMTKEELEASIRQILIDEGKISEEEQVQSQALV